MFAPSPTGCAATATRGTATRRRARRCLEGDEVGLASGCGCLGKLLQQASPVPLGLKNRALFVATRSVPVEAPVFELDTGGVLAVRDELHLDLRLEVGVILPVGGDIPGEHES